MNKKALILALLVLASVGCSEGQTTIKGDYTVRSGGCFTRSSYQTDHYKIQDGVVVFNDLGRDKRVIISTDSNLQIVSN